MEDNLIKQAKTICKPDKDDFEKYFKDYKVVDDGTIDDITQRISEYDARKFFEMWLKIQNSFAAEKESLE